MRFRKTALSLILVIVMMFTLFSVISFADTVNTDTNDRGSPMDQLKIMSDLNTCVKEVRVNPLETNYNDQYQHIDPGYIANIETIYIVNKDIDVAYMHIDPGKAI